MLVDLTKCGVRCSRCKSPPTVWVEVPCNIKFKPSDPSLGLRDEILALTSPMCDECAQGRKIVRPYP